jgi:hypothetical protein
MAKRPGVTGAGSAPEDRLEREAPVRLASNTSRDGWSDFVFAFHDGEELGSRMLARIAKRTGLRPGDL